MNVAIIPARGGSKRIPRKNIRDFCGKPLIGYALQAAQQCALIDRVLVSTDDEEIADIAKSFGAEVPFMRPSELADDFATTVPVIAHAIRACRDVGWSIENVCCIYPGVPFIRVGDLIEAFRLFQASDKTSFVFPVAEFPSPIQRALKRQKDGETAPFQTEHVETRTQDLEPAYFDAGQFYWGAADSWLSETDIHSNAHTIVLPQSRVVDIDTEEDWGRAELMFRALSAAV